MLILTFSCFPSLESDLQLMSNLANNDKKNTCSKHCLCLLHVRSQISPMVQMHSKMMTINQKKNILMGREESNVILQIMGLIKISKWCMQSGHANYIHIGSISPKLLPYVVPTSYNYIGPPWDQSQPKHILIPSIICSNKNQIPLKIAWELTIHKKKD